MLGISAFGMLHTVLSLVGLGAGTLALVRHGRVDFKSGAGATFIWFTIASCVTGFFIFRNGTFGAPHALGALTLLVLVAAIWAERRSAFGSYSVYVSTCLYSLSYFFHFIPGFTETLTRLPAGRPVATGPEDPLVAGLIGASFLAYLVGVTVQLMHLRRNRRLLGASA